MSWRVLLIAVVIFGRGSPWANAQEPYWVVGDGGLTCGQFLRAAGDEQKIRPPNAARNMLYAPSFISFSAWADGYLTRGNLDDGTARNIGKTVDRATRVDWLQTWCHGNPQSNYADALFALREELRRRP